MVQDHLSSKMRYLLIFHVFLSISYVEIQCANILGLFHVPGRSQFLAGTTLMKILAERGHNVTMVSAFKVNNPPKNFTNVMMNDLYDKFNRSNPNLFRRSNDRLDAFKLGFMCINMVENVLNDAKFCELMRSQGRFDVVIVDHFQSEALFYVAHHFNAPLILYSSLNAPWLNPYLGNPDSPAYVPNIFLPYSSNMSFFQRLHNFLLYVSLQVFREMYIIPKQNELLHAQYPNAPNLKEFIYNASVVLLNSDVSLQEPLPNVPSIINIGGFHIQKNKPLSQDLEDLLEKAENGVIYFNMGTNLRSKSMSEEQKNIFLNTFSKFNETVLWKFEENELPGKTDNVILREWWPQNDILAHRNVKLFITHGGLYSSMEAVYHGVPILCLPVFADQYLNSKRAEIGGFGRFVHFQDLTEEHLLSNLKEILGNPKYKKEAERRSYLMKDKPMSPADTLVYWVEHVIRHRGAPHLRVSALDLNWFQYLLLDIVLFITITVILLGYIIVKSCNLIAKSCKFEKVKKQ